MVDLPNRLRAWCEANGLGPDEGRKTKDEERITHHASRITDNWLTTATLLGIGELTLRDIVAGAPPPRPDPARICRR